MNNLAFDIRGDSGAYPASFRDAADLISVCNPDRPWFLFSSTELQRVAGVFRENFPGEVSYAVKANPDPLILEALWEAGVRSFDVASLGEIELVRGLFPESILHFNNPVRSADVTRAAWRDHGVRSFVVDDQSGLSQVLPFSGSGLEITVRFKLGHESAAYDFGSKFGATAQESVHLLQQAAEAGSRVSLTFHPGSQCIDPMVYARYIRTAAKIAADAGVKLSRLNVGGGFPVAYPGAAIRPVTEYFSVVEKAWRDAFPGRRPELLCEPGRAMVASCCSLLTQVLHIRDSGDVFVNDGVYGGLQEQAIMKTELPVRAWRGKDRLREKLVDRTIFGPTCDPVDRLSTRFPVPADLAPGDHLEFGLMGAYGSATATRFNGFEPPRYVLVD